MIVCLISDRPNYWDKIDIESIMNNEIGFESRLIYSILGIWKLEGKGMLHSLNELIKCDERHCKAK